jgi:hypothetical protein
MATGVYVSESSSGSLSKDEISIVPNPPGKKGSASNNPAEDAKPLEGERNIADEIGETHQTAAQARVTQALVRRVMEAAKDVRDKEKETEEAEDRLLEIDTNVRAHEIRNLAIEILDGQHDLNLAQRRLMLFFVAEQLFQDGKIRNRRVVPTIIADIFHNFLEGENTTEEDFATLLERINNFFNDKEPDKEYDISEGEHVKKSLEVLKKALKASGAAVISAEEIREYRDGKKFSFISDVPLSEGQEIKGSNEWYKFSGHMEEQQELKIYILYKFLRILKEAYGGRELPEGVLATLLEITNDTTYPLEQLPTKLVETYRNNVGGVFNGIIVEEETMTTYVATMKEMQEGYIKIRNERMEKETTFVSEVEEVNTPLTLLVSTLKQPMLWTQVVGGVLTLITPIGLLIELFLFLKGAGMEVSPTEIRTPGEVIEHKVDVKFAKFTGGGGKKVETPSKMEVGATKKKSQETDVSGAIANEGKEQEMSGEGIGLDEEQLADGVSEGMADGRPRKKKREGGAKEAAKNILGKGAGKKAPGSKKPPTAPSSQHKSKPPQKTTPARYRGAF